MSNCCQSTHSGLHSTYSMHATYLTILTKNSMGGACTLQARRPPLEFWRGKISKGAHYRCRFIGTIGGGGRSVSYARERSDRSGGGCGRRILPPMVGTFSKKKYQNRILEHLKTIFYGFKCSQISRRTTRVIH